MMNIHAYLPSCGASQTSRMQHRMLPTRNFFVCTLNTVELAVGHILRTLCRLFARAIGSVPFTIRTSKTRKNSRNAQLQRLCQRDCHKVPAYAYTYVQTTCAETSTTHAIARHPRGCSIFSSLKCVLMGYTLLKPAPFTLHIYETFSPLLYGLPHNYIAVCSAAAVFVPPPHPQSANPSGGWETEVNFG